MIEYSVIPYQTLINPFHKDDGFAKTITGKWEVLPFASNSVDLIVLPHTLDFSEDATTVIQEACRVLIPEGRLLIFGFNPFSLWRFKSYLTQERRGNKAKPVNCELKSAGSIKRELKQQNFKIIDQDYFLFQPPMKNIRMMEKLGFLNKISRFGLKGLSGIYFLEAQKKVEGMKAVHINQAFAYNKVKATTPVVTSVNRSQEETS